MLQECPDRHFNNIFAHLKSHVSYIGITGHPSVAVNVLIFPSETNGPVRLNSTWQELSLEDVIQVCF